ncbi:MAG: hypothetical protein H0X41_09235 [Chitinophagaceae bacterium]|nr:hypothetical protein [Chitinophagaceae bacterium]
MERLAELISKLKEQFEQKADTSKLLGITLLIERELMKPEVVKTPAVSSSKISVVMPAPRGGYQQKAEETVVEELPELPHQTQEEPEEPIQQKEIKPAPQPARQEFLFDPMQEIPTLAQQKSGREINELIGLRDPSLNDKLKNDRIEVGHVLTDHPIRDLKKAIGINDRHIFINELFRGDEVMYERSLKTINSFKIYAEAEYWIERELKVKLGWEEHKDTTKHFLQLIKRRFA